LCFALFQPPAVLAQDSLPSSRVTIGAEISKGTCASFSVSKLFKSAYVSNLPSISSTLFLNDVFGPVSKIEIMVNTPLPKQECLSSIDDLTAIKLMFDSDLASVSPRTGLLRNSASFRPAENVFVQLGLVNEAGVFVPLDLNQPQALNAALAKQNDSSVASQSLTLGIRYVASRSWLAQSGAAQTANTGSQDVTAGNISVFLPFLLKVN
jgi:hypothetical protein